MGQLRDSLDDRRVLPILAVAFNLDLVVWTSSRLAFISKALRKQSQFVRKYDMFTPQHSHTLGFLLPVRGIE